VGAALALLISTATRLTVLLWGFNSRMGMALPSLVLAKHDFEYIRSRLNG
jgi:hypothetical protein